MNCPFFDWKKFFRCRVGENVKFQCLLLNHIFDLTNMYVKISLQNDILFKNYQNFDRDKVKEGYKCIKHFLAI